MEQAVETRERCLKEIGKPNFRGLTSEHYTSKSNEVLSLQKDNNRVKNIAENKTLDAVANVTKEITGVAIQAFEKSADKVDTAYTREFDYYEDRLKKGDLSPEERAHCEQKRDEAADKIAENQDKLQNNVKWAIAVGATVILSVAGCKMVKISKPLITKK